MLPLRAAPAHAQSATSPPSLASSLGANAGDTLDIIVGDSLYADSLRRALLTPPPPPDRLAEVRANYTPENRAYARTQHALAFIEPFYGLLAGLIVLFSGLSARMRDIAHSMGRHRYVRVLVYLFLYSLLGFAMAFPLEWYRGFALEHQYGLSNQTFAAWMGDNGKGLLLSIVFFGVVPLIALAYGAIAKFPRTWWLWVAAATGPLVLLGVVLSPVLVEPAFNKFVPLRDVVLRDQILTLAAKADIPGRKVYEVNKSAQTKKFNAYVSGFGATQRIVLWDTTLQGMTADEILFVMGHEMGHYKLKHIWKGVLQTSVMAFVLLFLAWWVVNAATRRFGERWGFTDVSDVASMPLLAITLTVLSFAAQPAINGMSRSAEHEADIFGLEVTRTNDAAARAFIKLGSQNKSDPEPTAIEKWFLYSHPPLIERVRFAVEYRPWEQGKPNRFYHDKP